MTTPSLTDAYKITHWMQRPNVTHLSSYGEARTGGQHDEIVYFGMQYILKKYFMEQLTQEAIEKAFMNSKTCFGNDKYFPRHMWEKVLKLGYLPIKIRSVKEGTIVPTGNVLFTIEETEDWFAPMISHFENALMWNWYSCGVATRSAEIYKGILPSFNKSCDVPFLNFAVNDFGLRGGEFLEAASIGGAAHLLTFDGTDNLPARELIYDYYGKEWIGNSIYATEHSVATVFGPGEGEYDYVLHQLNQADDNDPISLVIDSYDVDNFMLKVINRPDIKQRIIDRPGRTVFRPDSNIPLTNVCKYSEWLGNSFGYHLNDKQYKVLNHNIGLIQGDGMNENSIPELYREYIKTGFSAENVVTGSGGGLLEEGLTRDTDRWAIKAHHAIVDGKEVDVRKVPQSDLTKQSKGGKLKLHKAGNSFMTIQSSKEKPGTFEGFTDELETVYENGNLLVDESFSTIRKRLKTYL